MTNADTDMIIVAIILFIMQSYKYGIESTILYMSDYPNLAYAMYALEEYAKYQYVIPEYLAGILICLTPILILFLIFQNSIMEKVHLGGLKG